MPPLPPNASSSSRVRLLHRDGGERWNIAKVFVCLATDVQDVLSAAITMLSMWLWWGFWMGVLSATSPEGWYHPLAPLWCCVGGVRGLDYGDDDFPRTCGRLAVWVHAVLSFLYLPSAMACQSPIANQEP